MGKQAPQAPDPAQTIAAQEQANTTQNLQTAEYNRINQYSPLGSSTYQVAGYNPDGTPQYQQTTSLSPQLDQIFNQYTKGQENLANIGLGMQGQVADSYARPLNYAGVPSVTGQVANNANAPGAMQQAENAAYGMQTQYLDPQFQWKKASLQNQLANQGITQGSQAYDQAMQQLGLQENQAYGNAAYQAVQAGQNEQNTLFGQGLEASNLQNQASGQALQQLFAQTNQPLNEYNALMTGAQVGVPQFSAAPAVNPQGVNAIGAYNQGYQNQLAAFNANQQGMNNLFGLGGNLAAAAILA